MTINTDKIEVSFYHNVNNECSYNSILIQFCPLCKSYKEIENFISHQKSKEFNIICRRCLDKQNSFRKAQSFKTFNLKLLYERYRR